MAIAIRRNQDPAEFKEWIEDLERCINDPDYAFAYDTLMGIYEWCDEKGAITEAQDEAVTNIMESING